MDSTIIDTITTDNLINESIQCKYHSKLYDITCFTCQKTFCSSCMCLERHPQEHIYFSTNSLQNFPLKNLLNLLSLSNTYINSVNNFLLPEIDSKISQLQKEQIEQEHFLSLFQTSLSKRYHSIITNLLSIKNFKYKFTSLQTEITSLLEVLSHKERNQTQINQKIKTLVDTISQEIHIEKGIFDNHKIMLQSHIDKFYPSLNDHMFIYEFNDFEKVINGEIQLKTNYIDSCMISINFVDWYIRIYPFGNDMKECNEYVLISLCMNEMKEEMKYHIYEKFTLINQNNQGENYVIEETGYKSKDNVKINKLYLREELKKKGFITEKGSLIVSCLFKEVDVDTFKNELWREQITEKKEDYLKGRKVVINDKNNFNNKVILVFWKILFIFIVLLLFLEFF